MSESINQSKPQTDHVITLEEFYTIGKPQKVVQDILSGTGEQFVQDSSEYKEAVQSIDMSRTAVLRLTMENAGDIE